MGNQPLESTMMPAATLPRSEPRLPATKPAAFDLKGTMAPLTVLRLRSVDLGLIERQLRVKIAQLPQLFLDAPVMLDLGALDEAEAAALPLAELAGMLRGCKLVPVAASNVPEPLRAPVTAAGLGVLQAAPAPRGREAGAVADAQRPPEPSAPAPLAAPAAHAGPMVITQPVRSGQVVHAQNNDLVVLAP